MTVIASEASGAEVQREYPRRAAVISWIFFDWAAQPYFTLITTFVFAPYFAGFVAPDPGQGQALWGFATAAAGLMIALLSPVLGAIADASGRRKPWIAGFGALLVIGASLMWFGKPGDPSVIPALLLAYSIASVGVEFATVFNNAMMPTLVPPDRIGRLSGTGWAAGYIGGILSLVLVLGFLAANPETGRTLFGLAPLFGLDPVSHQGDRITGPLTGIWFIIFVLPMFLLTPDYPAKRPIREALREGLSGLKRTLGELPKQKSVAAFLLANMIYTDELVARMSDRRGRRPAAGGVAHAPDTPRAEGSHRAVFWIVRADREGDVVHRPAPDRRDHARYREPEGRHGAAGGVFPCGPGAADAREGVRLTAAYPRHCERSEAIHLSPS